MLRYRVVRLLPCRTPLGLKIMFVCSMWLARDFRGRAAQHSIMLHAVGVAAARKLACCDNADAPLHLTYTMQSQQAFRRSMMLRSISQGNGVTAEPPLRHAHSILPAPKTLEHGGPMLQQSVAGPRTLSPAAPRLIAPHLHRLQRVQRHNPGL